MTQIAQMEEKAGPMAPEVLEAIKARHAAALPGPWYWRGGKACEVRLMGAHGNLVMVARRFGLNGATFDFNVGGILRKAQELFVPRTGQEHNARWNSDIGHPDAQFIGHAWEDIRALVAEVERLRSRCLLAELLLDASEELPEIINEKLKEQRDAALARANAADRQMVAMAGELKKQATANALCWRVTLEGILRSHYTCEDNYYSCPKSEFGCSDDRQVDCNCGAEEHNKRIRAALAALEKECV